MFARAAALAGLLILSLTPAAGQGAGRTYAVDGDCGGRPRTTVRMADGYCLGRVWQRTGGEGPRMPRTLLPLDGGDWLVSDLGTWDAGHGAVWRMSPTANGGVRWTRIIRNLSMPHTLTRGPDGRVYVAEMGRILAFDPEVSPVVLDTVIGGLPDNRLHENRHPLTAFVFDGDGALLVNVGAPSDRCLNAAGRPATDAAGQCAEGDEQAMIRRYAADGPGRWSRDWTPFATGLRNSVALARHPSGTLLQGENSIDLSAADRPFDEINRLRRGAHYGWPYCTDMATVMPGWTARQARCDQRQSPASLLPPHAAPLSMIWYDGAMFPELRGRLLMSWHGYRRGGGRVVAIETDPSGLPLTDTGARYAVYPRGSGLYPPDAPAPRARVLTPGWDAAAGRPMGAPVGLTVARDGSIWIADDRNAAILRIARP